MSSPTTFPKTMTVLRSISHELRKTFPKERKIMESEGMKYILGQYRKHQVTDQRICLADAQLYFLGETYLTYLNSLRLVKRLQNEYHTKGERSVEESAKLVGLGLPKSPET